MMHATHGRLPSARSNRTRYHIYGTMYLRHQMERGEDHPMSDPRLSAATAGRGSASGSTTLFLCLAIVASTKQLVVGKTG